MRRNIFPPLVVLILALLIAATSTSQAIVPEHGSSASGTGTFQFRNSLGQTEMWSFSFEALANKNAQARGRAQFENLTAQTHVTVRINCLSIDSPFAIMSGTVQHSDDPDLPKLENVIFAARDGELLPLPRIDTMTPPFLLPSGLDCHNTEPLTMLPIDSGDIEIQP